MKFSEAIQRHPYIYSGSAAFIVAVAGIETTAYVNNPTYDRPAGSCVSPFTTSETFVDEGTSTFWQTYMGINTTGVVAAGDLPHGAYGVEASFASPGASQAELDNNASDMLKSHGGAYALKMAIGSGEVQFAVRVVAPEGSALCDTAPDTVFSQKDSIDYDNAGGQLPWPNPVNAVTELF